MTERAVVSHYIAILAELRKQKGYTLEETADRAGIHRTTLGLLERGERAPSLETSIRLASALDARFSDVIELASKHAGEAPTIETMSPSGQRLANPAHFCNEEALIVETGLGYSTLQYAIDGCYMTLDFIDDQLVGNGIQPIANLVELANLSSMVGNLLGAGIAEGSAGLYARNRPHAYPDLIPLKAPAREIEIKMALETNRPKGHLPKPGTYITIRYVLGDRYGKFQRGKDSRGDTVWVWEVKVGQLRKEDFRESNTEGDSGKTAVIDSEAFDRMTIVYLVPELVPYGKKYSSTFLKKCAVG